jgi:hypothetical protein
MPWVFAKLMQVSPAMAVAKELQAGEMPACVSVSAGGWMLAIGELVLLAAVVDAFDPVPEPNGPDSLLDPTPMQ